MNETMTEKGRGEIEDLLPWYANGRLAPADRRRVETALAEDSDLARRLELVREEMAEAIAANEAIVPASSRAFDKLMAGIEASPRPVRPFAAVKAGLIDRVGGFLAALAPRRLAYVAAAVVAVVAIQSVALTGLVGERATTTYDTASQGEVAAAGPSVLVAFAPEARMEAVSAFLKRHGASLAEGPKANGFYRLRLAAGADVAAVAEAMGRETGLVSFVQTVR
jgi:anti-sigma-K factor RskA